MQRQSLSRIRAVLVATMAALALAVSFLVAAPTAAQAAPVVGFDPGRIIDDSLFYDGKAMNAAEVQAFLNRTGNACIIGSNGYKPGDTRTMGNGAIRYIAKSCLRTYTMNTTSIAANAYCAAYAGKANETAAQIITKVGQACNISQKVLMVMLQKEQSLLTDTWPYTRQYDAAMGYNCPDSGPNNSANCNPANFGFQNQVYQAARQLQRYKALPNNYNFKAGQNNTVQWSPNASCGASTFRIQNNATAALYIYTPYRPNQAALNAGWGTGDSCSAYGNRNFYLYYTSWFGSTVGTKFPVTGAIAAYWENAGMNQSWLGQPTAAAKSFSANGGGRTQTFSGGVLFEPTGGVVSAMTSASPILAAHNREGSVSGTWGWPTAPARNLGSSGNNSMQFQHGLVVESRSVGDAHLIPTILVANWNSSGALNGSWGAPNGTAVSASAGVQQSFQKGLIVRATNGTIRTIDPAFADFWVASGGVSGSYGLPTTADSSTVNANGGGKIYTLTHATLYNSAAGTFALPAGEIATAYRTAGGPSGSWSWPRGRQLCAEDGKTCTMDFVRGVATWSENRGARFGQLNVPAHSNPVLPGNDEKVVGGAL